MICPGSRPSETHSSGGPSGQDPRTRYIAWRVGAVRGAWLRAHCERRDERRSVQCRVARAPHNPYSGLDTSQGLCRLTSRCPRRRSLAHPERVRVTNAESGERASTYHPYRQARTHRPSCPGDPLTPVRAPLLGRRGSGFRPPTGCHRPDRTSRMKSDPPRSIRASSCTLEMAESSPVCAVPTAGGVPAAGPAVPERTDDDVPIVSAARPGAQANDHRSHWTR
jgi:hypothetical protein